MKHIIKQYLTSANNAVVRVREYLLGKGFKIADAKRNIVVVNGKTYQLTVTGVHETQATCRQFNLHLDGIITLWMVNGCFYVYSKGQLNIGNRTRQLAGIDYYDVQAKEKFKEEHLIQGIIPITSDRYRKLASGAVSEAKEEIENFLDNIK